MTFWELVSIFREESGTLQEELVRSDWAQFAAWYANFDGHVTRQDRDVLDATVPDDLFKRIASRSLLQFSLSPDGWLRRYTPHPIHVEMCQPLSALDVYEQFGGGCLEEVQECGSCRVRTLPTPPTR
jgi:hypothetical protein